MLTRSLLLRKGRVDTGRKGKSRKCTTTVQEVDEKGALRGGRMFAYVPDKSSGTNHGSPVTNSFS